MSAIANDRAVGVHAAEAEVVDYIDALLAPSDTIAPAAVAAPGPRAGDAMARAAAPPPVPDATAAPAGAAQALDGPAQPAAMEEATMPRHRFDAGSPAPPHSAAALRPLPPVARSLPARAAAAMLAAPALAREPDAGAPAAAQTARWLRVSITGDRYALELLRVQEVVRLAPIVGMRGAAPAVLGVMNLRGRIVPVWDLGRWLGAAEVVADERARIVVVERNDELIGLLVSSVDDVVSLSAELVEPPYRATAQRRRSADRATVGVARPGGVPTVLLDANALFD